VSPFEASLADSARNATVWDLIADPNWWAAIEVQTDLSAADRITINAQLCALEYSFDSATQPLPSTEESSVFGAEGPRWSASFATACGLAEVAYDAATSMFETLCSILATATGDNLPAEEVS